MAKATKILGVLLADRSGSMISCKDSSQEAINDFFTERAAAKTIPEFWSLDHFDDKYEEVFGFTPVDDVPKYTLEPRGSTALMDSIGQIVKKLESKKAEKGFKSATPMVVIVTDGFENASTEHTKASIKALITAKTGEGWQFIYLGANQDAMAEGNSYGIHTNTSMTYDTAYAGAATASASSMITRGAGGQSYSFTPDERSASIGNTHSVKPASWVGVNPTVYTSPAWVDDEDDDPFIFCPV